ncbi:alpha beta-hydrolase [Obba rivulosa]|uniref:Alpha beta-hydrolase n=1 Tax=Obba rivulosa TaxID=1052685 RepID=A0A8E2B483_9APHY|nr:alpha beta-hydrolase [Obba rivulosa]
MLADVKDLFHFLQHHINGLLRAERARVLGQYDLERRYYRPNFQVNPNCIAVAGSSAGGLCAYLAATHASPRPKAVLSLYGMGGDFMTSHYLSPKTEVFFRGRELLDASQFSEYLYPQCLTLKATADSALTYHSGDSPTPGLPSNPRMYLARLYLQKGVYLDYYTGCHDPSISKTLRHLHSGEDGSESTSCSHILIPAEHLPLFPQYAVSADWPPTFLIHGTSDTAVHVHESLCMESALQSAGVRVALRAIEDEEHSFDYAPGAEEQFGQAGGLFDEAVDFLLHQMQSPAH